MGVVANGRRMEELFYVIQIVVFTMGIFGKCRRIGHVASIQSTDFVLGHLVPTTPTNDGIVAQMVFERSDIVVRQSEDGFHVVDFTQTAIVQSIQILYVPGGALASAAGGKDGDPTFFLQFSEKLKILVIFEHKGIVVVDPGTKTPLVPTRVEASIFNSDIRWSFEGHNGIQ